MIEQKPGFNLEEWRIKKALRRQKQHQTNLLRAKSMHKFRIRESSEIKQNNKIKLSEKIYIGCSGWFYWKWKGKIYPKESKTSEWFNIYRKKFYTVELNAPFYSWPTLNTVRTWYKQAKTNHFIYTIKVSELITHIRKFVGTKELIKDFDIIADVLGKRFGCFLYQCPPSFKFTSARLKRIVKQLNLNRRNVIEFRHKSWWNKEVYDTFRKHNIIFCSSSSPKLPDDLIQTADDIYIRFHGKSKWYKHHYTKQELAEWVKKIKKSKASHIWAYFNNDWEGNAVFNAKEFIKQLKKNDNNFIRN
jgi:uncharacterized protein YecE (DUF72 family)